MTPAADQSWTTRRLLAWMTQAFEQRDLDAPRRMAEALVAHVLGTERLKLYMDPDRPASPLERQTLRDLVRRALDHEPVQYLIGEESFFGLMFHVDPRVLIPRPSTQTIVDEVLRHSRKTPGFGGHRESDAGAGVLIADVCTGSGCVGITLAKHLPAARVVATDVSDDALAVARTNAARHQVDDRVEFARGDLLEPLDGHPATRGAGSVDYLCANPPYIPDDEWADVEPNVKDHEPELALRGGADGLDLARLLVQDGPLRLRAGGLLLVEVAASRADATRELAERHPDLSSARIVKDSDGLPRTLVAERAGRRSD